MEFDFIRYFDIQYREMNENLEQYNRRAENSHEVIGSFVNGKEVLRGELAEAVSFVSAMQPSYCSLLTQAHPRRSAIMEKERQKVTRARKGNKKEISDAKISLPKNLVG